MKKSFENILFFTELTPIHEGVSDESKFLTFPLCFSLLVSFFEFHGNSVIFGMGCVKSIFTGTMI